jgi:sulfate-transporting ATPase
MQYIYTMNGVSKIVPPKRQIIKDISLSFFPGAKIGLLGVNGAGKSTVLKIMAGVDTDFQGEARANPGTKIGYLAQEPQLDPEKTVREASRKACPKFSMRRSGSKRSTPPMPKKAPTSTSSLSSSRSSKNLLAANDAHALERQLEVAADALRLPPWDAKIGRCPVVKSAAWRCAACCCPSPTCCCSTSRPTIWTPSRSTGWSSSCTTIPAPWWR